MFSCYLEEWNGPNWSFSFILFCILIIIYIRFPLYMYIEQLKHIPNYWFKLSDKRRNSILNNSFKVDQTLWLINTNHQYFLCLENTLIQSPVTKQAENIPELANQRNVNRIFVQQLCGVFISKWYNTCRLHNDCILNLAKRISSGHTVFSKPSLSLSYIYNVITSLLIAILWPVSDALHTSYLLK